MTTRIYVPSKGDKLLYFINDKLIEVELESVTLEPRRFMDDGECQLHFVRYTAIHNGEKYNITNPENLYTTEQSFLNKKNVGNNCDTHSFVNDLFGVDLDYAYYYNDELVLEYDMSKHLDYVEYNFITGEKTIVGFLPDKLYKNKENVMLYNPIIYTDIDGNKVRKEGKLSKLLPNAEQKVLIEQFRELVDKMYKAKLEAYYDYEQFCWFNMENVEELSYYDNVGGEDVIIIKEHHKDNIVKVFEPYVCGDGFEVRLKKDNQ
jgi:hypothetical protein